MGDEAFEHHGLLVTFKPGVPIEVAGVRVDYLTPHSLGSHLERALRPPSEKGRLCVVDLEDLIFMKLVARRRQDLLDIVELLKCGGNPGKIRSYLERNGPERLETFEELLVEASSG